ncbi:MAG TPA: ABC transporter permease [Opitutaceae bacterium]|nr:ABC transporter permease [Opitutaceae bacterium]
MISDLRLALRQLRQAPGFTAVAVLSLALGIGANTTIFSLVNEVLLKSLPVRAPEELVIFSWAAEPGVGPRGSSGWSLRDPVTGATTSTSLSHPTYEAFRAAASDAALADIFAFAPVRLNLVFDGQAEAAAGGQVASANYHAVLGVPMVAGRSFRPEEDLPSAAPVVVISDRFWRTRLAADPAVIGKTITVNGVVAEIVGVTTPRFTGTLQVGEMQDITVPLGLYERIAPDDTEARLPSYWWLRIMGRLKPGVTREQLTSALSGVFRESIREGIRTRGRPDGEKPSPEKILFRVGDGAQGLSEARRSYAQSLGILTGLVALVLLVACANVANLLLARGAARQREIAVRLALGASRPRLLRQLLTESTLLGLLGGGAGVCVALWGREALLALQPLGRSAVMLAMPLDWRVLGFTTALGIGTGILFGLAPAWRATRLDLAAGFQGGTRTLGAGRSGLARALMVVQVALSFVLLAGAGLFTRTLVNLQRVDPGFASDRLLLFSLDAMSAGRKREEVAPLYTRIAERLAPLPGVQSATYSHQPILSASRWTSGIYLEGSTATPGQEPGAVMNGIDPAFFRTYGLSVVLGRAFTARDDAAAPKVAIVNQAFARKHFGEESPLGRRFGLGGARTSTEIEIVGVVRDFKAVGLREEPAPAVYLPYPQLRNMRAGHFAIRAAGDLDALAASVRGVVRDIDATLPVNNLRTQDEQIARLVAPERMFARLAGFFGLLALVLAGVGLYGLLAYNVLRRTGEIGLRMALGAVPARVLWMILRQALVLVGIGIVLGLGAALAAGRLVSSRLFGLTPSDPPTYAAVVGILVLIALVAAYLPARRAARVSPMQALRTE